MPDFSGRDVVKALSKNRFVIVGRTGSHVKLRYEHPTNDDDVCVVSVPQHDRIRVRTLRNDTERVNSVGRCCQDWDCSLRVRYSLTSVGTITPTPITTAPDTHVGGSEPLCMAKSSIMANVMNPAIILFSRETISTGSCLGRQLLYEFAYNTCSLYRCYRQRSSINDNTAWLNWSGSSRNGQ